MKGSASPKHKRGLFVLLLVACLGIWGYVLYQMGSSMDAEAVTSTTAFVPTGKRVSVPLEVRLYAPYDSSFRDPFARPPALFVVEPAVSGEEPEPEPEEPAVVTPPVTLSGIVGATALLRHESGTAHIAQVGEEVAGVRLLVVRRDHIIVRFEEHPHTLRLKR